MQISKFALRRFRAFDTEAIVPLSDFTVLVGPNNLGKSTILRALSIFFSNLQRTRRGIARRYERTDRYDGAKDYPKRWEGRRGRRWPTRLAATFAFSDTDRTEFENTTEHTYEIPCGLTLQMEMQPNQPAFIRPQVTCPEVSGHDHLEAIIHWIGGSFRYVYIPATRNIEDFRRSVFSEIIDGAIRTTSQARRRVDALERFYSDISESVSRLQETLSERIKGYLPDVCSIEFVLEELDLLRFVSVRNVMIDDGANTSLSQKGDGFNSLFALTLLQFLAEQRYGTNLVFGIEEPEAHLHSSAVYEVKSSLRELSANFQVVLTTHSPILIQRDDVRSNIIIDRAPGSDFAATARPGRNLAQIRQSLGIRPQDNLTTAAVVVVVEGATEETALSPLMIRLCPSLEEPILSGSVRVLGSGGASRVVATLRALARDAVSCVVLLDADEEGQRERERILKSGLVNPADLFSVPARDGCQETEFEDMFEPDMYAAVVGNACGMELDASAVRLARQQSGSNRTRMAKWSDVMAQLCNQHGHNWDDCADDAKTAFGAVVADNADQVPVRQIQFIRSIGHQVARYLQER